jgi:hypothetical protein
MGSNRPIHVFERSGLSLIHRGTDDLMPPPAEDFTPASASMTSSVSSTRTRPSVDRPTCRAHSCGRLL